MMNTAAINSIIQKACKQIAPAWPLENSVAVNPFLGFSDIPFKHAARIFNERNGIQLYMPFDFYLEQIDTEEISKKDIAEALQKRGLNFSTSEFMQRARALQNSNLKEPKLTGFTGFVDDAQQTDFKDLIRTQIAAFLSVYFNHTEAENQPAKEMYEKWKRETAYDYTAELHGIKGFREFVQQLPDQPQAAILQNLTKLNVPEEVLEAYLHSLLLDLLGWSSYCAGVDWQNNLYGGDTHFTEAILAIIISWEAALTTNFETLKASWRNSLTSYHTNQQELGNHHSLSYRGVFQDAYDIAFQRKLIRKFEQKAPTSTSTGQNDKKLAQAVFCIDVRSETYRRNLEAANPNIETIGFAGFFGFPIQYHPLNHTKGKNQCPALIPAGAKVVENTPKHDREKLEQAKRLSGKLKQAWSKFKSGSVSSFSFVSPLGIFYLPKLISDSMGWTKPVTAPKEKEYGTVISGKTTLDISQIPMENRIEMAKNALIGMGLTRNFAQFVLITGHGSSSVNNPHASGLDCGACGGSSGEINALTAQLILNDPKVREHLAKADIHIPKDTCFVACLHDTTTDEIKVLEPSIIPQELQEKFKEVTSALLLASEKARQDRSVRFNIDKNKATANFFKRANDWSQVRPEWGLSGCNAFVIAPRERTKHIDLGGKSFLHSYDWKTDKDFGTLEAILTAPMVVTSWINLQYYASTVDNARLGAGNKTLHNVTASIGVMEGGKGDLRIGLPLQSIHDGNTYQHLPLRLNVVIEAPTEAIDKILQKHPAVKELFDNEWISLLSLNKEGKISKRYTGMLQWEKLSGYESIKSNTNEYEVESV